MARGLRLKTTAEEEEKKEYQVEDMVPDRLNSSQNSRLELVGRLPPLRRHSRLGGADGAGEGGFLHGRIIHPNNKYVSVSIAALLTRPACSS